jgi:beta-galactosidase
VLWSIGNECPEQEKPRGAKLAAMMARFIRKLDPTRPVGYGAHPGYAKRPLPGSAKLWEALDVAGYNYRDDLYASDHKAYPERCILGSETFSLYAFQTWTRAVENKHIIGEFIWTGMDYIGESGIGMAREEHRGYPVNTACCGELDVCGFKKTRSYYRDILWDNGTELHIAVRRRLAEGEPFRLSQWGWPAAKSSWTWPEARRTWPTDVGGHDVQVDVYSACDEVKLILNGRTIGRNTTSRASRYMASWIIPYEPGVLEAVGYRGGKKVAHQVLRTAGEPAKLRLSPDRKTIAADGYDLSFVTVEVLDGKGALHPNADNEIRFSVSGPGEIAAVGNGDPASVESFQAPKRKAYNGRCQVVVKSKHGARPGVVKVVARAKGLRPASTTIRAR